MDRTNLMRQRGYSIRRIILDDDTILINPTGPPRLRREKPQMIKFHSRDRSLGRHLSMMFKKERFTPNDATNGICPTQATENTYYNF